MVEARRDLCGNLPAQLSSFVGRAREVDEIADLVRRHRLVTLTGAGGSGKTRLALHVADAVAGEHPDGVWWADLAPLTDASLVPAAVAAALGIPEPREPIIETLARRLDGRRALVLLDNCEHLIDACATIAAQLVRSCDALAVLATSRELLGVTGETRYPVPPLALPEEGAEAESEAVRLFVDRAQAARPGFELSAETTPAVAEICRRLDGIPLAIELAAARTRHLGVAEIADGLTDRFRLLVGNANAALPRQRTLEGSVDWSHDLLPARERAVFRRLGVFAGTFTLAAAEAVCAGGEVSEADVLDALSALVDRSLVQVADDAGPRTRYRLLETMRDYARHKLADAGEADDTRERHLAWCVAFVEEAAAGLAGEAASTWLAQVDAELPNVRAALDWSTTAADPDAGVRIVGSLTLYWFNRSELTVGRSRLEATLARGADGPHRASALSALCHVAYRAGAMEDAARLGDEAIAIARRLEDPLVLGRALHFRAWVRFWGEADRAGAWRDFEEAEGLFRQAGDSLFLGLNLCVLGWFYVDTTRAPQARALLEEGLALLPASGALRAYGLFALGWLDDLQGNDDARDRRLQECVRIADDAGDRYIELIARSVLALQAIEDHRYDDAREQCEIGLTRALEHRLPQGEAGLRSAIATLRLVGGDLDAAGAEYELAGSRTPMPWFVALVQGAQAQLALAQSRASDARATAEDALRLGRAHDSVLAMWPALSALAAIAAGEGDLHRAEDLLHDALDLGATAGYVPVVRGTLKRLAGIVAAQDRGEEATRLLAAAAAMGNKHAGDDFAWWLFAAASTPEAERLRDALGVEAFDTAWTEGAAMSLDEAVDYARRGRGQRRRPTHGWPSLTPTERKVVALVAEGLTNPQIGQRLFISRRTVQTHLAHVFAKLHVSTRTELATAATMHAIGDAT